MSALPPNYLAKKGRPWKHIRLLDVAVLLYNMHLGAADESVGFEDAAESLETLTRKLNKQILVEPAVLESLLWSSNLLHEQGKWHHPKGVDFNEWVNSLIKPDRFERYFHLIERKE